MKVKSVYIGLSHFLFFYHHTAECQRLPNNHTLLSLDKMHFKLTSFFTMAICATLALAGPIEKRCDPNDAAAVAGCHDCTANCVNNANPYAQAGCYAGNASLYSDTMIVY